MKKLLISVLLCGGFITVSCQPLKITSVTNSKLSNGGTEGSLQVKISGGTPNYTYKIAGPTNRALAATNSTSAEFDNLAGGYYTVTVTDSAGQTATKEATVNFFKSPIANRMKLAYCKAK